MNKKLLFVSFIASQLIFAQQTDISSVIGNFSNKNNITWNIPINDNQQVSITWHERKTSLSSEGIRTFAGYAEGNFVGVISIHKKSISGNISWEGKNYILSTQKGQISITEDTIKDECGIHHHEEHTHHTEHHTPRAKALSYKALNIDPSHIDNIPEIYTDGVLRVYRLAILVDYNLFKSTNITKVKQFWAETETFLNELYTRDLSIRFEVVKDEKLIRKTESERIFQDNQTPYNISNEATKKINAIIGENAYDVGIAATRGNTGQNGVGGLFSVYSKDTKADAWVSVLRPSTVAHEVGHLFGASHTYSTGGAQDSMNTEPSRGQSIMSYNHDLPRDFFSLPSVNLIRKGIQNNADYYTDLERTQRVGPQNSGNIVYGIATNNQPPIINRSKLKSEYILPQNTHFQFHIPATDPEGHSLLYVAHQADIRLKERSGFAIVRSAKPQTDPTVVFYPQYKISNNNAELIAHSAPLSSVFGNNNERNFWLGVSDAGELSQNPDHAVRYDMFPTKVEFVSGTPFKITSTDRKSYNAGEKITLTWGADTNVFGANSKVKISMSDDFGQSWKYVLVPETANDGSEKITIPHIELGKKQHTPSISSGLGLLKIEVIGHIAVAITDNNPNGGGFEIKKSAISFGNLPEQTISVKEGQVPEKANVIANTTCGSSSNPLSVQFNENQSNGLITRVWTASDTCGNTATFTQYIEVKKNVEPLQFVGNLPQNIHIECPNGAVPAPETLQVTGGTNPQITFTQTRLDGNYENHTLKRTWIATDADAEPISHTQIVVIHDGVKPVLSEYPQDIIAKSWADVPQTPTITATDNCDGNVEVQMSGYGDTDEKGRQIMIYSWTAKDKSGNVTRHEQRITIDPNHDPTLSTREFEGKNTNVLYPNPVNDSFSLNVKNIKAVKIYNTDGRLVKTFESQTKYDVSRLVSGVYLVVVETQNGVENMKFIKK